MRIFEWLAFLAPALIPAPTSAAKADSPYPHSWKHKEGQLDIRPAIKSLIEHPEDWSRDTAGYVLTHTPSRHEFWVSTHAAGIHLWRAPGPDGQLQTTCSCVQHGQNRNIHRSQKKAFWCAYQQWRIPVEAKRDAEINKQFASHFNGTR